MSHKNIRSLFLFPFLPAVLIFLMGLSPLANAGNSAKSWSIGLEGGVNKLTEGYWDYSNLDQFGGMIIGHGLSPHWNGQLALRYSHVRPGVSAPQDEAGWNFDSSNSLYTIMWQPSAMMQYRFAPNSRFCPTMGVGLGLTSWKVLDMDGKDVGLFPSGDAVKGFDTNGEEKDLTGTDLTISLELGLDFFITESISFNAGGRYHLMPGNEIDNIGLSYLWGADHVDANTALAQGYVGLTMWFGDTGRDSAKGLSNAAPSSGIPVSKNVGDSVEAAPTQIEMPAPVTVEPKAAPAPAPEVAAAVIVYADDKDVLEGVSFKSGSAQLTAASIGVLAEVASRLRTTPEDKFEIRGHTDSSGPSESNRDLSQRRAISVRDSLIQMGVTASNLSAVGYGEDFPLVSNATSDGRLKNRRVELHKIN